MKRRLTNSIGCLAGMDLRLLVQLHNIWVVVLGETKHLRLNQLLCLPNFVMYRLEEISLGYTVYFQAGGRSNRENRPETRMSPVYAVSVFRVWVVKLLWFLLCLCRKRGRDPRQWVLIWIEYNAAQPGDVSVWMRVDLVDNLPLEGLDDCRLSQRIDGRIV